MAVITVTSTADSGSGSLRQALLDAASGDTIVFDDTVFPENIQTTILLSSQLSMPSKDLIIDGGGHWTDTSGNLKTRVVLNGQGVYRAVYGGGANVFTLNDITFNNCYEANGAAAQIRYNADDIKTNVFNYCVFDTCVTSSGGAVRTSNKAITEFNNSVFINCSKTENGTSYGGGIFGYNTSQNTVNNCVFDTCTATYGGAIAAGSSSVNTVNNCTFNNCAASTYGNAIYIYNTSQTEINNCSFIPPENNTKTTIYSSGTNENGSLVISGANSCDIITVAANSTTVINGKLTAGTLTINNGASVTFSGVDSILAATTTATIGSATFAAADGATGYAAFPTGTNISAATFTGVKNCTYGAGIESASLSRTNVTWTATNLSTDVLIEQQNGDSWTTLTNTGTGGSYIGTFGEGTTVRLFDGVAFWYASTQFPYWVVNSFAVTNNDWIVTPYAISTNGGGGTDPVTGDPLPSWTVNTADITPNFKGL